MQARRPFRDKGLAVMVMLAGWLLTSCESLQRPPQARFPEDLGPDLIEYDQLATYPKPMQANYVVFAKRCSKCHTPARPLYSAYASPAMWARYVTKMSRKIGSRISREDAQRILAFLVYDSQVRKLDHRQEFEAHRRRLFEAFKAKDPERYHELYDDDPEPAISLK